MKYKINNHSNTQDSKTHKHKRYDVILILGLMVVAGAVWVIVSFVVNKQGDYAIVKIDGEVVYKLDLSENTQVTIDNEYGKNVITVEDGFVYMEDADCPDKVCVRTGKINKSGQTIVCLPHKVVIEITGEDTSYDSIAR